MKHVKIYEDFKPKQYRTVDLAKLYYDIWKFRGELESEFVYLISDTIPFSSPPDWFVQLANKLTEAYFWEKQNGNSDMVKATQEKIKMERLKRYGQVQAITRGNVF